MNEELIIIKQKDWDEMETFLEKNANFKINVNVLGIDKKVINISDSIEDRVTKLINRYFDAHGDEEILTNADVISSVMQEIAVEQDIIHMIKMKKFAEYMDSDDGFLYSAVDLLPKFI